VHADDDVHVEVEQAREQHLHLGVEVAPGVEAAEALAAGVGLQPLVLHLALEGVQRVDDDRLVLPVLVRPTALHLQERQQVEHVLAVADGDEGHLAVGDGGQASLAVGVDRLGPVGGQARLACARTADEHGLEHCLATGRVLLDASRLDLQSHGVSLMADHLLPVMGASRCAWCRSRKARSGAGWEARSR
jgi:hypothetical protein